MDYNPIFITLQEFYTNLNPELGYAMKINWSGFKKNMILGQ